MVESFIIVSVAAVDRSLGVVGENNVDTVEALLAKESPIELCRFKVPMLCRRRRGDVRRSVALGGLGIFGKRKSDSSSA